MRRRRATGRKPAKTQQTIKAKRGAASKAARKRRPSASSEETKVARLARERDDAVERLTATSDVLKVISSSPGDLQAVFAAILANAVRLCEAEFGTLFRCEGKAFRWAAGFHTPPDIAKYYASRGLFEPTQGTHFDRVIRTKRVSHSADYPDTVLGGLTKLGGARSIIVVPMLKEDALLGAIGIYRKEARPFTDKQIALVQNFSNQAVIAIENARLLNELRESLEQQTATAEVLGVISSTPGELTPVFETMLANATRLCEAQFGTLWLCEEDAFRAVALHNAPLEYKELRRSEPLHRPRAKSPLGRLAKTKQFIHVTDTLAESEESRASLTTRVAGARTLVVVPMLKEEELTGAITIYRQEVRPFTDKQIALVKNFASQAVIAIENTRLLNELRESLQQRTATADVLKVISSSPGELKPVFDAMLENATRICEASFGNLLLMEGDNEFRTVALHNPPPAFADAIQRSPVRRPGPGNTLTRMAETRQEVHIADITADPSLTGRLIGKFAGARTLLSVPLLKENKLIGALSIYRQEVRPFTDKQIELVKSFAAQAVIAIENTRLLNELRESLQQQTATADVLRVISSSPGELEPVFETMLENATRLCEAKFGALYLHEGGVIHSVAAHNVPPAYAEARNRRGPFHPDAASTLSEVIRTKQTTQLADLAATQRYAERHPVTVEAVELGGVRTTVNVPMLKDNELIGIIIIYRQEVRPFTEKQLALLNNFANQAVIAIENARLLNELRESLQQQTATADVLSVISSSPGELEPVFQAMLANAVRICDAKFGVLHRYDNETFAPGAEFGLPPALAEFLWQRGAFRPVAGRFLDHLLRTKDVVHLADAAAGASAEPAAFAAAQFGGARSLIAVPMLKENVLIGAIIIYRQEVKPFTDKQIALVKNFASQAVIAIENTRLLNELRQRTDDLSESLQQQTATSEVLRVISSSPGELEPVFEAMLANAVGVCEAKFGHLHLYERGALRTIASHNVPPALTEALTRISHKIPA